MAERVVASGCFFREKRKKVLERREKKGDWERSKMICMYK